MQSLGNNARGSANLKNSAAEISLVLISEIHTNRALAVPNLGSSKLTAVDRSGNPVTSEELLRFWRIDKQVEYVSTADLKFSRYFLASEAFKKCQALVFWDPVFNEGGLGHFNPQTDPYQLLNGNTFDTFGAFKQSVPIAKKQFDDPGRVRVAHLYRESHSFPPEWVNSALELRGFSREPVHIKVDAPFFHVGFNPAGGQIFVIHGEDPTPSGYRFVKPPRF